MAEPQSESSPASRLVIRVKLHPDEPSPPLGEWHVGRIALVLILGVVAIALCWFGIRGFKPHQSSPSIAARTEAASVVRDTPLPKPATEAPVANPPEGEVKSAEPEVQPQPNAPISTVHEVIPNVPRSALETISGTVRVSVRVIVDKQGAVVAATPDNSGPSRYFERLSVDAAKGWMFTPTSSDEQRIMLVRFNFTRFGATAHANPVP